MAETVVMEMDFETKTAATSLTSLRTIYTKQFNLIKTATNKATTGMVKGFKAAYHQQDVCIKAMKKANQVYEDSQTGIAGVTAAITEQKREIEKLNQEIKKGGKTEGLQEQQEALKEMESELELWKEAAKEASEAIRETHKLADAEIHVVSEDLENAFREGSETLVAPFEAFIQKDLKGMLVGTTKLWEKTFAKIGKSFSSVGFGAKGKGAELMARGKATRAAGGGGGKMDMAMGGLLKGMGAAMSTIGPALNMISKLGPLVGMLGSSVMAIVKLFLDAEAAAKDFNREVLATAGTGSFLSANFGNADAAAEDLNQTLRSIRDSAFDKDLNLSLGIMSKTHSEILNTLTSEGISLQRLATETKAIGKEGAGGWKKITEMNVAYSRNIGVSLQEIGSMQAQMMADTGMGLRSVEDSFTGIIRGASEAGMATNTFFNIIRGVSADLSLYNGRIGDAVKMLTKLGKVMSAKSAQKFMQSISNAVRGMGRIQRLQVGLLAGEGKVKEIVGRDLKSHAEGFAKTIAQNMAPPGEADKMTQQIMDEYAKAGPEGVKVLKAKMEEAVKAGKISKEAMGPLNESLSNLSIKTKMASKGIYGLSQAAAEGGVGAQHELLTAALAKFSGGKSLKDAVGSIGTEQMAENLGVSREQLNQMVMFEDAMDDQKSTLKDQMKKDEKGTIEKLAKLGINIKKATDIDKLGTQDLLSTMDEGDRKALEEATKVVDYTKKTAVFQTSILSKLDILIEWFINQLYNAVMGIWEAITSLPGFSGQRAQMDEQKKLAAIQKKVLQSGDDKLLAAWKTSQGDQWKFRDEMVKGQDGFINNLRAADKKLADLNTKLADPNSTEAEKKGLEIQKDELLTSKTQAVTDVLSKATAEQQYAAVAAMMKQGTISQEKGNKILDKWLLHVGGTTMVDPSKSLRNVLWELGEDLTAGETTELIKETEWTFSPEQWTELSRSFDSMGSLDVLKKLAGAPGTPAAPAATDEYSEDTVFPTAPGATAPAVAATADSTKTAEATLKATTTTADTLEDQKNLLKNKGIALNKSKIELNVKPAIQDATLEALRTALWEFALLTQFDKVKAWATDFASSGEKPGLEAVGKLVAGSETHQTSIGGTKAPGKALGGLVTGIGPNGIAITRPAPGEGLTSIGVGERIVPAGGAGGGVTVTLELKGDLGRLIEAKAQETMVKNQAASKYR